jgi:putative CocE/NonD family hydrolase
MGYRSAASALLALCAALSSAAVPAQSNRESTDERPAKMVTTTEGYDYERRVVMIPMRDKVKLFTVIMIPQGARRAPILLTRTPYNADDMTSQVKSGHMAMALDGYDNMPDVEATGEYIRVVQDVRGKYGSEGEYVMNRPLVGPLNPTKVDHSTDTWDTIDWLVKHVPESNGRVGIIGISYDGFTPLMALVNPHPALKVAVPMNSMVDGWRGDDWFHNGAFRSNSLPYIYEQVGTRDNSQHWWSSYRDEYDFWMTGSVGEIARRYGLEQVGFWRKIAAHPAYDEFWQQQAMDRVLAAQPLKVPVMLVHGLWDQEDIYGPLAVWRALKPKDADGTMVHLVIGPWNHGQQIEDGSSLGAVRFGQDTSYWFRHKVLAPFLAQHLKDGAPAADIATVTAFESGTNEWRRLSAWPSGAESSHKLYLKPHGELGFEPASGAAATEDYDSDPAKPVPYRARPILPVGYEGELTWPRWLVDDQREASGRTDVLTFVSPVLDAPVKVSGTPLVNLNAATTGTDADWVVKLIDVYPPEVPGDRAMGGYQLAIAMDILRGRYRESLSKAAPIESNEALDYRFALPDVNHVFLPGHRIMVQVQSSWFPLYDRNPQTFVPNIFFASPKDYVKATHRVTVAGLQESFIDLPVTPAGP